MPQFRRPVLVALLLMLALTACSNPQPSSSGTGPSPSFPVPNPFPPGSASTTPRPSASISAEDSCVSTTLAKLSLRQVAGQVVMVGTPLDNPGQIGGMIHSLGLGGVFLAGRTTASAASLRGTIGNLQHNAGVGLLVALDQEGGQIQTLRGPDFPDIPSAVDQGKESQATLKNQATAWAGRLAAIGVNMDLAPVADTVPASLGPANPPIGAYDRQYGSDPNAVAADITTVVTAVQSQGVITTIKHFPGLGRVLANTDTSTDAVDNQTSRTDPFLAPFQAGIRAGTGAVMVSSASYPRLDAHAIAAFSAPIITTLLRQQLGFTGLVVSDDLGNAVAVANVPVDQRAVKFVAAGGDLALTVDLGTAAAFVNGLLAAANASPGFGAKLTQAATTVLRTKYRAGLLPCSAQ
jgi:beta-N-acetylhexosaminidase